MSNEQMMHWFNYRNPCIYISELSSDYIAAMESIIYFIVLFIAYSMVQELLTIAGALGVFFSLKGGPITDLAMLTMMSILYLYLENWANPAQLFLVLQVLYLEHYLQI